MYFNVLVAGFESSRLDPRHELARPQARAPCGRTHSRSPRRLSLTRHLPRSQTEASAPFDPSLPPLPRQESPGPCAQRVDQSAQLDCRTLAPANGRANSSPATAPTLTHPAENPPPVPSPFPRTPASPVRRRRQRGPTTLNNEGIPTHSRQSFLRRGSESQLAPVAIYYPREVGVLCERGLPQF